MDKNSIISSMIFGLLALSPHLHAIPINRPTQWYLSVGTVAHSENSVSLEVSERLFDRAHLIMQTRYESHDLIPDEDGFSFIPQMTSLWEQACLVELNPKNHQRAFFDLGFGYELRRYAYYDLFDDHVEHFWEPSFVLPMTLHLDSFFHQWDAATDMKIIMELTPDSHSRTTVLTHQMFSLSKLEREMFFKLFLIHHYTAFSDDYFSPVNNCSLGFIFESLSL